MKTVKEYANSVGKSHQSVYKQLNSKKNKERLENHVWKQDGTTYLDDVAIDILNESRQMISLLLENKEKTFLLEQKKDQTEEINRLKKELDQEKKEQLNEIEMLKNELEKEKNKGFFARLFGK